MAQHTVGKHGSIVSEIVRSLIFLGTLFTFPAISLAAEKFETPVGFAVSPTGAATFNIPIEVPPGTAGMAPSLSLSYNSQGGNGMLGVGWGLSGLSVIARCGQTIIQDGVNGGVGYTASDRFCLDGQRLVVVANASGVTGVYGANLTEYRTERESFTRIVSYGTTGSGPTYFIVQTKAGQTIQYGNTTDSRVEAQGRTDIREWAVNKISELSGNYMTVSYTEDGTTLRAPNANGDYYPLRIDYTGNTAAALATYNSVRFIYQTRTDNSPSYLGGSVIKTMLRMSNVKTYAKVNGVDTPVKDYQLGYLNNAAPNNSSRFVSETECLGDDSVCLPVTTLGWQTATGTQSFASGVSWINTGGNIPIIADFNGDGLADMAILTPNCFMSCTNSVNVYYSTGKGFSAPTNLNFASLLYVSSVFAGDLNGDGKADLMDSNGVVYLSTGSGFASGVSWINTGGNIPIIADFNGDGLADVALFSSVVGFGGFVTNNFSVSYSTGKGFSAPTNLNFASLLYVSSVFAGDLNGDGKADLMDSNGVVYLSTGSGFASGVSWINTGGNIPIIADFNGDGLADVALFSSVVGFGGFVTNNFSVSYSTGKGFSAPTNLSFSSMYVESNAYAGDFNGDGKADLMDSNGNVYLPQTPTSDLLNSVTTGLGNNTAINYQLISNTAVYVPDTGGVYPVRDVNVKVPLNVVASATVPDGIGYTRSTSYKYYGLKTHLWGGGFLGFRQYDVTDQSTGIKTSTVFTQDYPHQGLPTSVVQYQPNGNVLHSVANTWAYTTYPDTVLPVAPATYANTKGSKHHFPAITNSGEITKELNNSTVTQVTSGTVYDAYGNATSVTTSTTDGFSKTVTNTYAQPNLTNWIIGRLINSTVQSTSP